MRTSFRILDPAFPFSALPCPIFPGRVKRCSHVEDRSQRQRQRPQWIETVRAKQGPIADNHKQPSRATQSGRRDAMRRNYEQRRKQVCDGHSRHRQQKQNSGVAELIESAARNHPAYPGKTFIRTNAASGGGSSKPQTSAIELDPRRQRAVVDNLLPNGVKSAGSFERSRTDENASAGSA